MRFRTLLVSAGLLVLVCGIASSQPAPRTSPDLPPIIRAQSAALPSDLPAIPAVPSALTVPQTDAIPVPLPSLTRLADSSPPPVGPVGPVAKLPPPPPPPFDHSPPPPPVVVVPPPPAVVP